MTPKEALEVVDRAASQVQAVRAFHEQVVVAVKVLSDLVRANQGNDNLDDKQPGEVVKAESAIPEVNETTPNNESSLSIEDEVTE